MKIDVDSPNESRDGYKEKSLGRNLIEICLYIIIFYFLIRGFAELIYAFLNWKT